MQVVRVRQQEEQRGRQNKRVLKTEKVLTICDNGTRGVNKEVLKKKENNRF